MRNRCSHRLHRGGHHGGQQREHHHERRQHCDSGLYFGRLGGCRHCQWAGREHECRDQWCAEQPDPHRECRSIVVPVCAGATELNGFINSITTPAFQALLPTFDLMLADLARSYTSLGRAILRFPKAPWEDALSHGQLQSKAWAIGELARLRRNLGVVYIVGGWLGTLALLMFEAPLRFKRIRSFDIDPRCEAIADQADIEHVITDWRFKAVTLDMFKLNYGKDHRYGIRAPSRSMTEQSETCDTVINTCCDHIRDFNAGGH